MSTAMLRAASAVLAFLGVAAGPATAQQPPDQPLRRQLYLEEQRAYPFDRVPRAALQSARRQALARWPAAFAAARMTQGAGVPATTWQPLGPAPIADRDAGRLSTIAIDPRDPNVLYIGAAQGGVWKTTNGGVTWTALTDDQCSLAMGALLLDPVNPDIVYAGTGELHFSGDSYYGCGILRSTDGGQSWVHLGADVFDAGIGARISKIVMDPASAGSTATARLVVASSYGLFRSVDGGTSWTRTLDGIVTDLVMHPTDANRLYAAIGFPVERPENGVYRSNDGGVSWTRLAGGFPVQNVGRIALAIAPSAPQILFAAVQDAFEGGGSDAQLLGIWKSTDAGATWARLPDSGAACGSQCWYDLVIAVDPHNPERVYFGGVQLYRSTDGGNSFFNILNGIHVDQHAIVFHPTNPQIVFAGNDGGIYRSNNAGASWTTLNTNLSITQFYSGIALHPTDAGRILGGTQDNGTLEYAAMPSWLQVIGGDGGFTAIDPNAPTTAYAETQWQQGSGFSGPRRRTAGQGFFQLKRAGIDMSDRALFIPPLVMDPTDSHVLYFGTFRVYRTADRADSWLPISPDLTNGGSVSAIAPAPSSPQTIYVGTSDGRLHVTTDRGASWSLRNAGLPDRFITDITVDRSDPQSAIAVVSGFGTGHVFRTSNGGASWQDMSGNLPDVPVNAALTHASFGGDIYIGTDLGMFRSLNGGGAWEPFNDGFPNVAVFDLAYNDGTGRLVAATHGRGMFVTQPVSVSAIIALPSAVSFDAVGDSAALQATALNEAGMPLPDPSISWASLDADVASVNDRGVVISRGNGTTSVVAAMGGRADSVTVTVAQVVTGVAGMPDTTTFVLGEKRALPGMAVDRNGSPVPGAPLAWVSRQPTVASVDGSGNVTGLAKGETVIVASAALSADSTRLRVLPPTVLAIQPLSPSETSASSRRGTHVPVLRLILDADGAEAVRVTRVGVDVSGNDPGARISLVHDVNGNGRFDAQEPRLTQLSRPLLPGATERLLLNLDLTIPAGGSAALLVGVEMGGSAPNGAIFRGTFVPGETRTLALLSGAANLVDEPGEPFEAEPVVATVLDADQHVAISENPVRGPKVVFNFSMSPTIAAVYTIGGRRIADLTRRLAGLTVDWDLTNDEGTAVGPGVYLLVFEVDGRVVRDKLMILR